MVLLVEVARWSRELDPTDPDGRAKLEQFLESPWLNVVEVDRRMARFARDVVATTSVRTGVDALYVATAVIVEARFVYSWDAHLQTVTYQAVTGSEPPGAAQTRLDIE